MCFVVNVWDDQVKFDVDVGKSVFGLEKLVEIMWIKLFLFVLYIDQ